MGLQILPMGLADYLASHYADRPDKKEKKEKKKTKKEGKWKSLDAKVAKPVESPAPATQETVYRDNEGKVIDQRQWQQLHGQRAADPEENKGIVQRMQKEQQALELAQIADQPLERYKDDPLRNEQLKQQARTDDPMALQAAPEAAPAAAASKYTGIPLYAGGYPENRFGIAPSYKWDGIDRSNGFEKRWLAAHDRTLP